VSESGLHRFAVIGVVCSLAGVLTGAMVTSSGATAFGQLHEITAGVSALIVAILGVWLIAKRVSTGLGGALLALVAAAAALGLAPDSPTVGIFHALLAQTLFAAAAAAMVATGAEWSREPDLVEDHGWPSLGSLGKITPVLVWLQIALGAAFRHKAMGILSHLFGAMVLVLVILCLCIFVMQQFPDHKVLRPAANLLMGIAFTQIFLGIAAFTVRSMTTKTTPLVVGVTAAHACVGAMTLASAVVLGMQIRRNVFKPEEPAE
jgi:hypothetical protein